MRRWPCIAAAPGAAFVLVDAALAVALGNSSVFVPLLVIGPLVAAALASPRCTLGVALLAVACALPLGLAEDRFVSAQHLGEVLAVAAGGVLAVLAAKGRRSYEEALVSERAARGLRRPRGAAARRAARARGDAARDRANGRARPGRAVPGGPRARRCAGRDDRLRHQPPHAADAARIAYALPARSRGAPPRRRRRAHGPS